MILSVLCDFHKVGAIIFESHSISLFICCAPFEMEYVKSLLGQNIQCFHYSSGLVCFTLLKNVLFSFQIFSNRSIMFPEIFSLFCPGSRLLSRPKLAPPLCTSRPFLTQIFGSSFHFISHWFSIKTLFMCPFTSSL